MKNPIVPAHILSTLTAAVLFAGTLPGQAAPTVTLSTSEPDVFAPYTVEVDFDEAVTGLEDSDFAVTNGTASDLDAIDEYFYTVLITPTAPGDVTVVLPADSVTSINDSSGNEVSNSLVTNYDPTISSLLNLRNGDLNTPVPPLPGTTDGSDPWSFDPATNTVLFNGADSSMGANEWIDTGISRGSTYDPDGGAGGAADGAFVGDPSVDPFNQKPRAEFYFVDDNKQSTGLLDFGLDVFLDDNTAANDLLFQVELYAWNDGENGPLLSAGGKLANDPAYNLTDLGDAVTILNTQVLATEVADAAWETVLLGTADVGTGYDNYAWRIGVLGATTDDIFAFDNVTVTVGTAPAEIKVTDITVAANGDATIDFTSTGGNVDVYRSTDLQTWGAAIATDIPPGSYTDTSAPAGKAFYTLVSTGAAFP